MELLFHMITLTTDKNSKWDAEFIGVDEERFYTDMDTRDEITLNTFRAFHHEYH
ncbi:hypothetical protein ACTXT7_008263, partial [Hymenolepis weldensis]